jgi:hypothetical protein
MSISLKSTKIALLNRNQSLKKFLQAAPLSLTPMKYRSYSHFQIKRKWKRFSVKTQIFLNSNNQEQKKEILVKQTYLTKKYIN